MKFGFIGGCQLPFKVIFKEVSSCELHLIDVSTSSKQTSLEIENKLCFVSNREVVLWALSLYERTADSHLVTCSYTLGTHAGLVLFKILGKHLKIFHKF